jgi:hypothetical protein
MNPVTKCSMSEAEIQNLLDVWTQAGSKVWNAVYGMAAAHAPDPWRDFLERSAEPCQQIVESLLKVQAAGVGTALRALDPVNGMQQFVAAWGEGFRRFAETAVDAQSKSGVASSQAIAEPNLPATGNQSIAGPGEALGEPAADLAAPGAARQLDTNPERRGKDRAFTRKHGSGAAAGAFATPSDVQGNTEKNVR